MPGSVEIRGLSRDILLDVAKKIGREWQMVLRNLGLQEHELYELEVENDKKRGSIADRNFEGLKRWLESAESQPKYEDLCEALEKAQCPVAAEVRIKLSLERVTETAAGATIESSDDRKGYHCIGREKEVNKIVQYCSPKSDVRITVLAGLPGVGKTKVLRDANTRLQQLYPDYLIYRPPIASNCDTFEKLSIQVLECIDPGADYRCLKNTPNYVKRMLHSINKPFLLILDISHIVSNDTFWDNLLDHSSLLMQPSKPYMKVLLSINHIPLYSHVRLPSRKVIFVHELGERASVCLIRNISPVISEEKAKEIYQHCGGIPIILRHVAKNFKGDPNNIDKMLDEIDNYNMPGCSLQGILRESILNKHYEVLFNSMDKHYKSAMVKLSFISGTIDDHMMAELLDKGEVNCIGTLVKRYLLLERRETVYFMHPVIREFVDYYRGEVKGFEKSYRQAQKKYIKMHLDMLHALNNVFMNSRLIRPSKYIEQAVENGSRMFRCECVEEELCSCAFDIVSCRCPRASISANVFNEKKSHIMYSLHRGLEIPDMANSVIDCVTHTISFLNKTLSYKELQSLLEQMHHKAVDKGDNLRLAYVFVSLVFVRMAAFGTKSYTEDLCELLKVATRILESGRTALKRCRNLEVLAHCYSKLGRLMAQRDSKMEDGKVFIENAIKIREKEIQGDDNIVLQAATYVDLANIYRDTACCKEGLDLLEKKVMPIYKQYLYLHPFTASTLRFIGKIYHHMGQFKKAKRYYLLALQIQSRLRIFKTDKMASHRELGECYIHLKDYDNARIHLEKAKELEESCFDRIYHNRHLLLNLQTVYEKLGNNEKQERCMEDLSALQRFKKNPRHRRTFEGDCLRNASVMFKEFAEEEDAANKRTSYFCNMVRTHIVKWTVFVMCTGAAVSYVLLFPKGAQECPIREYAQFLL